MTARRLRVSHVVVQVVLVYDDGQELIAGPPTQTQTLPLSALAGFGEQVLSDLEQMNQGLETPPEGVPSDDNGG